LVDIARDMRVRSSYAGSSRHRGGGGTGPVCELKASLFLSQQGLERGPRLAFAARSRERGVASHRDRAFAGREVPSETRTTGGEVEGAAAIKIQSAQRAKAARHIAALKASFLHAFALKRQRNERGFVATDRGREKAARLIQSQQRQKTAKQVAALKRSLKGKQEERRDRSPDKRQARAEEAAAVTIQSAQRAKEARRVGELKRSMSEHREERQGRQIERSEAASLQSERGFLRKEQVRVASMPAGPGKEAVVAELKAKEAMVSAKEKALRQASSGLFR